ncbi:MAG: 2-phospho-L-lactate transferase [Methanobacteriaceae archaeon]|uniref:2-phospho-L-lactate transferase n=1 Tax=Methanobrevibacter TaxID=2172 RepID=UPI002A14FF20|nr:2-phospho-L-lactate transferase [Methanobacteriaceae archaeon]MDD3408800.1 2-phospho-L-lactate transferase [Methanobacteriaceae archaeon]MDD4593509.1 2-phospho-L-lactate transferase [Methanobacteriaceae archaeon]
MITILSGGTGTPKLIQGLKNIVDAEDINIIVNTVENDYFSGVYVSADIDTVLYTLSDIINEDLWYGIKDDTFITNERLSEIGSPELLRIGDKDRSTKIQKTLLLKDYSLTEAVDIQRKGLNIKSKVYPMSDEDSEIKILTDKGEMEFHDFLIKEQMKPEVLDVIYSNVKPAPEIINTIQNSDIVIIGPSNPITSILPILKLDGVIDALKSTYVVGVSPIVGGSAVSGPANKFMNALGYETSSYGIASIYKSFLNKMVIDLKDENLKSEIGKIIPEVTVTNTIMKTMEDKKNLAKNCLKKI